MKGASLATRGLRVSSASVFVSMSLILGLASCGGGTEAVPGETTVASSKMLSAVTEAAAVSVVTGANVIALTKISETRISRTVYDYVFKVSIQNGPIPQTRVLATLTAVGSGTTIVDGTAFVGDMSAGGIVSSPDTITLRHDRAFTFDTSALVWKIVGTADTNYAFATIGPDGGKVSTPSGIVQIEFPTGALLTTTPITISPSLDVVPLDHFGNNTFEFGPDGTTFSVPVTITLQYDPLLLPPDVLESNLSIAFVSGNSLVNIPTTVDTVNKVLIGQTTHFSVYAINNKGKLPHGTAMGDFKDVVAYSNGCADPAKEQCVPNVVFKDDENYNSVPNNDPGGSSFITGLKWQCVEFVNRYFYKIYKIDIRKNGGNANTYFDTNSKEGTLDKRGLMPFPNDQTMVPPQIGDIIASNGTGVGHVAIVRDIVSRVGGGFTVYTIQQNLHEIASDMYVPLTMTRNATTLKFHIDGYFSNSYAIAGWLRAPSASNACNLPQVIDNGVCVTPTPTPVVTSFLPSQMIANKGLQALTIVGSGFTSGSQVQFKWGVGTGANVWHNAERVPTTQTDNQITIGLQTGTVADSIGIRVCRAGYAITNSDCSTQQMITITASAPAPTFREEFNGTSLNGNYWTGVIGISDYTVANSTIQFNRASYAHTNGKVSFEGNKIIVEARFGGLTSNGRDTNIALVDVASGDRIQAGDTNYFGQGYYVYATGAYGLGQLSTGSPSTNAYLEYRITLEDRTLTLERGSSLNNLTFKKVFTLAQSSVGRRYYLQIGTGGGIEYSPGTFDWVQITAPTVNAQPAPPSNFPTTCNGQSTVMGGWTRFGTATYNTATNTYSVGDTIGFSDPNDSDGDCNQVASWTPSGTNTQDNDWLVYNRSTTGDIDFSSEACIPHSPVSGHLIGLFVVDPAFTGLPRSGHNPYTGGVVHFSTQWNLPGRLYVGGTGVGPIFIPNAVMTAKGFCGTYRTTRVGNLYSAYFNNSLIVSVVGTTAAIVPVVVAYDNVVEMNPTVIFPN